MKFRIICDVTVKNDGITHDAGRDDIADILIDNIQRNELTDLSWVIAIDYSLYYEEKHA